MQGKLELELKYRLTDRAAAARFLSDAPVGAFHGPAAERPAPVEDRYVDTADGALRMAGYAARFRRTDAGLIVSVKSLRQALRAARRLSRRAAEAGITLDSAVANAVHVRRELEGPADSSVAPILWPDSEARSLLLELCGDAPLDELVVVRQQRHRRLLASPAARVELSLDEVEVELAGLVIDRFTELEIELLEGEAVELEALAVALRDEPGLASVRSSKLERALGAVERHRSDLAEAEPTAPSADSDVEAPFTSLVPAAPGVTAPAVAAPAKSDRPRTPGVAPADLLGEAGRKVLRFHFLRMLDHLDGTRDGADPEELHDMRVAVRRMRAAFRVFGDGFDPGATRRPQRRLRRLASRLGAVRDLDVQLAAARAHLDALPDEPARDAFRPLLDAWERDREKAREELLKELGSAGFERFIDAFDRFTQTEGEGLAAVDATEPRRVRELAGSATWTALEHVRAFEPILRWADLDTLHQLRIAGKRLRDTVEQLREVLGPEVAAVLPRIVALQDHLGALQDARVAATMTRAFLVCESDRLSPAEVAAVGRYLELRERDVTELRRGLGRPWRALTARSFRRALAMAVAAV